MKLKKAGAFTVITKPIKIEKERIERIEDILVQAELEIEDDNVKINSLKINSQDISISIKDNNCELNYNHQTITVKGNNLNLKNTIYLLINIINNYSNNSAKKIDKLLSSIELNNSGFWVDISNIVQKFNDSIDFQQKIDGQDEGLFQKYKLSELETTQNFITIDPSIIQLMIFDNIQPQTEDKVYSLKLIKRKDQNKLTFRYTTRLFPNGSKITDYDKLETFKNFNNNLDITTVKQTNNDKSFMEFLKKYLKFYNFYKKCYLIPETTPSKKIVDYQLRYISILGKARFGDIDLKKRTGVITEYIMSNLLFMNPTYAFISGGYKGFKHEKYGVTRSGYEMAKRYNRPVLTIMCKEGLFDSHLYSDATYIYGEHWGEDSIALSQFTDGAIIIAPFGGWTYIECLTLLKNRKIVGIYNNFFNILNIDKPDNNKNFLKFAPSEQDSILNYYINYYLILLFLINDKKSEASYNGIYDCIDHILKLLFYLKNNKNSDSLSPILIIINDIKTAINNFVSINLEAINELYKNFCTDHSYQINIPENCDGIWIKPSFNLSDCIKSNNHKVDNTYDDLYNIDITMLKGNKIFTNLNLNIIFVFSDVYSLNIYLKEKLNSSEYQTLLQQKIDELEKSNSLLRNISRSLSYNRNMDSSFDEERGVINKEIKLRDKYEFFIEEKCNNYKLIEYDEVSDSKPVTQTPLRQQELQIEQIEQQISTQNEVRNKLEKTEVEIIKKTINKYPNLSHLGESFYSRTSRNLFDPDIKKLFKQITTPRSSRSRPFSGTEKE
jgi:hypothetical protein